MSRPQGRSSWKIMLFGLVFGLGLSAQANEPQAVPGEYLVKFKKGVLQNHPALMNQTLGNSEVVSTIPGQDIVVIKRNMLETQNFVVDSLAQNEMIEVVEPNYIYTINKLPNDPRLEELWGLQNNGQRDPNGSTGVAGIDVGAERAWDIQTGSKDVIVAVIDTGVDYTHPDLVENMWVNEAEANGLEGVDDDGNGFVDDIHGYDFANNDGDPMDDNAHGTHVSGTIGAKGDDGKGVVGVAWNVRIMAIKFLAGRGGGTLDDAIKSIDYATKMGAHIQSNSWGGGGYSQLLEEAIQRSAEANSIFIAAAGNHKANNDLRPTYPSSYDVENVVSVAAIDNKGKMASFSCYGATSVDLAAPGVNIMSSFPNKNYRSISGTSMATPHVSGIAALVLSNEPELTAVELKERLISTARPLESLSGKMVSGGIADAYHALTNTRAPADPNDPSNWDSVEMAVSTPHPYAENFSQSWEVEVEGATKIAIHFASFEVENGYDKVYIYNASGERVATMTGNNDNTWSAIIEGSSARVELVSDRSVTGYGFDVDKVAYQ